MLSLLYGVKTIKLRKFVRWRLVSNLGALHQTNERKKMASERKKMARRTERGKSVVTS